MLGNQEMDTRTQRASSLRMLGSILWDAVFADNYPSLPWALNQCRHCVDSCYLQYSLEHSKQAQYTLFQVFPIRVWFNVWMWDL